MVSAAGMSAAYGGYQKARKADNEIQSGDIANQQAQTGLEADTAWGNTIPVLQQMLQPGASPMPGSPSPSGGGMPPAGPAPQAPPPGQSSQPMHAPAPQQAGPQPQMLGGPAPPNDPTMSVAPGQQNAAPPGSVGDRFGGLPGGGAQDSALPSTAAPTSGPSPSMGARPPLAPQQPQQPQAGQLNLHTVMAAVVKANPGAKPAVIAAAVAKALPFMTAQSQIDYKQLMTQFAGVRAQTGRENADTNAAYKGARLDQIDDDIDTRKKREERAGKALDYRMVRDSLNRDVQYQRLEQSKQTAIERGDMAAARAAIDAAHKRALEYIATGRTATGTIDPADVPKIRAEADKAYNEEILRLSGRSRGAPPAAKPTTQAPAPAAAAGQPGAAPVKVATPQEAQALKPGTPYITPDGQSYTR